MVISRSFVLIGIVSPLSVLDIPREPAVQKNCGLAIADWRLRIGDCGLPIPEFTTTAFLQSAIRNPQSLSADCHSGFDSTHGPESAVDQEFLKALVLPDFVAVAERRIKHPSLAIRMAPGQSEILVGPVHILYRQVHGAGLQTQEQR